MSFFFTLITPELIHHLKNPVESLDPSIYISTNYRHRIARSLGKKTEVVKLTVREYLTFGQCGPHLRTSMYSAAFEHPVQQIRTHDLWGRRFGAGCRRLIMSLCIPIRWPVKKFQVISSVYTSVLLIKYVPIEF